MGVFLPIDIGSGGCRLFQSEQAPVTPQPQGEDWGIAFLLPCPSSIAQLLSKAFDISTGGGKVRSNDVSEMRRCSLLARAS
jgi:hypothetical protein